jgi:hypothetical protein
MLECSRVTVKRHTTSAHLGVRTMASFADWDFVRLREEWIPFLDDITDSPPEVMTKERWWQFRFITDNLLISVHRVAPAVDAVDLAEMAALDPANLPSLGRMRIMAMRANDVVSAAFSEVHARLLHRDIPSEMRRLAEQIDPKKPPKKIIAKILLYMADKDDVAVAALPTNVPTATPAPESPLWMRPMLEWKEASLARISTKSSARRNMIYCLLYA